MSYPNSEKQLNGKIKQGDIHVHLYFDGKKSKKYRKASKKEKRLVMTAMHGRE